MKNSDIFGRIMAQVTSGRWLITVASIYCLVVLTKTLCALMANGKVTLETATYVAIVMSILNTVGMVTVFYFQKNRPDPNVQDPNVQDPNVMDPNEPDPNVVDPNCDSTTTTTTLPKI